MCITSGKSEMSNTIVGNYKMADGRHVCFYQNRNEPIGDRTLAQMPAVRHQLLSMSRRPGNFQVEQIPANYSIAGLNPESVDNNEPRGNALVIPIFTDAANFDAIELLNTTAVPSFLFDIRDALSPRTRSLTLSLERGINEDVRIEQMGIYTVVICRSASQIPEATKAVEARKRPVLNQALFDHLAQDYDVPFAVACFSNEDIGDSLPIAFAYEPKWPEIFLLYTMDAHDGNYPDYDAAVGLDHTIFAAAHGMIGGVSPWYTDQAVAFYHNLWKSHGGPGAFADDGTGHQSVEKLARYLPTTVNGLTIRKGNRMINGDIMVSIEALMRGHFEAYRVLPANAPSRAPIKLSEAGR